MNEERIKIEDSESYWEKHSNRNSWTLEKPYFIIGKSWWYDKMGTHIYGWVDQVTIGENAGKYEAGCPTVYNEETDSDAEDLGIFDTLEEAMKIVLERNHPDYSSIHV